jgi:choline dehydrogenase-like flavoprotein
MASPPHLVIVGSGVAGALLASQMSGAGWRVTVLEGGPPVTGTEYPEVIPGPSWSDESTFYEQKGPQLWGAMYERVLGGSTWHWTGTCLRLLPEDFQMHRRYGVGVDWPFRYAELEPYYSRAEHELGVCGDSLEALGSPRSREYPMPPLLPTVLDQQVLGAARGLGYRVQVLPAARNSQPYQGRPACCGAATCTPRCPVGAKYDATVHLKKALAQGASLRPHCLVKQLLTREGRIESVQLLDGTQVEGDLFALCANAIETPRLLLRSGIEHPAIGRYLMGQPTQVSQALTPEPNYPFRSPQVVSGLVGFRSGSFRRQRGAFFTSIGNDGWPGHTPPELAKKGMTPAQIRQHAERQMLLVTSVEQLPWAHNRLTLSSQLDSLGLQRPRVEYRIEEYSLEGVDEAVRIHARIFQAMGATHIHHYEDSRDAAHAAGTVRCGSDRRSAPVDANLRFFDWPNLWTVGAQVFPTQGTAPPTLTVAALALRCADYLLAMGAKTKSF